MSYELGSSRLQAIFESAYRDYETRTGMTLAAQPFVQQLEDHHTVRSITTLLQGHIPTFRGYSRSYRDRMMEPIECIVSEIWMLSSIVTLDDAIDLV
jgi:hypothetical protein